MASVAKITLRQPIPIGVNDPNPIRELVLKPSGRFYRDQKMTVRGDGSSDFDVYAFAVVGVRMAGHPAADKVVDLMDPADMMEVATAVMGFLGGDPQTGTTPSPQ